MPRSTWCLLLIVGGLTVAAGAQSTISYTATGSTYTQNFNTLPASGSPGWFNTPGSASLPGWSVWRNPSTGTSGVRDATAFGATNCAADNGTSTFTQFFSYGSTGSTDRAMGSVAGSVYNDVLFVFAVTNNTGSTITNFTLGWNLEQWRQGGQTAESPALGTFHGLIFDYTIVAGASVPAAHTSANFVSGYTAPGGVFDGTGPVGTAAAASAVNGNTLGLQAGRGGTVSGLSWAPGSTLILRWWDDNNVGNDHGLAIDDFNFTALPTPGTAALIGVGLVASCRRRRIFTQS